MISKTKLSKEYDRLYKEGQKILDTYNPCQIEVKNGKVSCVNSRNHKSFGSENVLCCGNCRYHKDSGCSVKCLACKTYLCTTAYNKLPKYAKKKLNKIQKRVTFLRLAHFFRPKYKSIIDAIDMYSRHMRQIYYWHREDF
ncbi:MAG: hypothetical protein WC346_17295 [Methanogenium sp.]|jgi:hypothetical protein